MYDQHSNGARLKQLNLGETIRMNALCDLGAPTCTTIDHSYIKTLRAALAACTSPAQRLRCACVGRKARLDPAKDGAANAVAVLWDSLFLGIPDPPAPPLRTAHSKEQDLSVAANCTHESDSESGPSAVSFTYTTTPDGLLTLPNKLQIHSHFERAPEETVFLYEEIFERQVYANAVRGLQPGDLVVDVGE